MPASGLSSSPAALSTRQLEVGNPNAAQDLYGLGVRVGFYLQALGMILYNYGDKKDCGKGLKVASGSIAVSILASWFIFAARELFSPSEAIIVLLVLMNLSFPAKTTLLNPRTVIGETIGLIVMLVVELGTCGALVWTFARLVDTLPTLQTDNVVFFFAKVPMNGWFRILALVCCILDAISSQLFMYKVVRVTAIAWECYKNNLTEESEITGIEAKIENIIEWKEMQTSIQILRWLTWILVIVAVELTMRWNHLSPSTDLQAPGQLIPFVTGIIILIDSSFVAARAARQVAYVRSFFGFIAVVMNGVIAGAPLFSWLAQPGMARLVPIWERVRRRKVYGTLPFIQMTFNEPRADVRTGESA